MLARHTLKYRQQKFVKQSETILMKILQKSMWLGSFFLLAVHTGCDSNNKAQTDQNTKKEDSMISTKDPHSFAEPSEAVMTHLNWEATVDFEAKRIEGVAKISIKTDGDAKKLILDSKNLEIQKVTLGDSEDSASYQLGEGADPHMGSSLTIDLKSDTRLVNIHYNTTEGAEALQWLNPMQTAGKKHPFLFTQSQAILARTWVPLQDSPGIRFTYEAKVSVPKELMALMSAENPQVKSEDGIYHFKMDQPIPAYLLALAVGDLAFEPIGDRTGVYAEPEVMEKAVNEFAEVEKMVTVAEGLYGPYRWDRYDLLVLPPSFPFGGMENPRLTFATPTILAGDRSLTSLVAHELAHSWSGNLVTNATWNDFWLNEGFTVYFENRIMEEMYGKSYADMLASLALKGLREEVKAMTENGNAADTRLKLDLDDRNPDDGVTSIAYDKGHFFLRKLEEIAGRETFDDFLQEYFDANAFKTMTTEDFIAYANEHLFEKNKILVDNDIYDAWIYSEGLPENVPEVSAERFVKVDSVISNWGSGKPAAALQTTNWSTHEWLHFLGNLPANLSVSQMKELDQTFGFTNSGNSEILTAWFVHTIRNNYSDANQSLENFLVEVGRRKFLMPLYGELIKTEEGKKMASRIYEKARPNYHFVSVNSIDAMLGYKR